MIRPTERLVLTTVVWGALGRRKDICADGPATLAAARWVLNKQLKLTWASASSEIF